MTKVWIPAPMHRLISDWRVKTLAQKLLGFLPGDLSLRANEWVVSRLRGSGFERIDIPDRVAKGLANLWLVRRRLGLNLAGGHVLELGTGWHGTDLVLFHLAGAERIYTVDRFGFLTSDTLGETVGRVCRAITERCSGQDGRSLLAPERIARLQQLHSEGGTSVPWFRELNVVYAAEPAEHWTSVEVPPNSIDLVYSESLLQRLPTERLRDIMSASVRQWLRHEGGFFHRTDQKDIHALSHADANRWPLEYLKYPDWLFDIFLNGSLMYQNRLRESDFVRLFEECGLSVEYVESLCLPEDVDRVRSMDVAARFEGYSATDLATRSSRFIGRSGPGAGGHRPEHRVLSEEEWVDR